MDFKSKIRIKLFLVNSLTLLRIPLTVIFDIALFYEERRLFFCTVLFSVIVLTDFFDGKLARYYNSQSKIGAVFDVGTDFFFIFTANYILYKQALLPLAMIAIIVIKFAEFCLTSYLLTKKLKADCPLFFDKIGRFLAAALYSIPIITLLLHTSLQTDIFNCIVLCTSITIGLLSLASLYARVNGLIKAKRIK